MRTATITLDSTALIHNLAQVKRLAPKSQVLAMVKADAYGHGLAHCIHALLGTRLQGNTAKHGTHTDTDTDTHISTHTDVKTDNPPNPSGADAIGVATFEEAKHARLLGWDKPIVMIEGAFSEAEWRQCHTFEIACVAHHHAQIAWALQHLPADTSPSRTIWLKINTGMNRLGFAPNQVLSIAKQLHKAGYHLVLTSHFANADANAHPLNAQQIATFKQLLNSLHTQLSPHIKASMCNSAGIIHFPECHYDWVRPGIMLYGSSPSATYTARQLNLRPVMCFAAQLMAIQTVASGASVGYGSTFTASSALIKGIVSVGYGDGYPRVIGVDKHLAWVSLHHNDGRVYRCDIIGRVSMDMLAIDITDVPHPSIGDRVILWGDDRLGCPHVDDVALHSGTISYELLCRLSQRPIRQVV